MKMILLRYLDEKESIDIYGFNKDTTDILNKAGRINQEKGILIPYFMIYSVKIDKETSEELLR